MSENGHRGKFCVEVYKIKNKQFAERKWIKKEIVIIWAENGGHVEINKECVGKVCELYVVDCVMRRLPYELDFFFFWHSLTPPICCLQLPHIPFHIFVPCPWLHTWAELVSLLWSGSESSSAEVKATLWGKSSLKSKFHELDTSNKTKRTQISHMHLYSQDSSVIKFPSVVLLIQQIMQIHKMDPPEHKFWYGWQKQSNSHINIYIY